MPILLEAEYCVVFFISTLCIPTEILDLNIRIIKTCRGLGFSGSQSQCLESISRILGLILYKILRSKCYKIAVDIGRVFTLASIRIEKKKG